MGEDEKNRGGKGTERSLDYAPFGPPFVAPSISPFVAPFEAQGKQGEQGKQFKVEEGKIRRAKRPEPLGVNADTLA